MPIYTYRREDGTTFDMKQSFHDDPLEVDPKTGQKVQRVIHNAGVIFKGSGFYVTDNRGSSRVSTSNNGNGNGNGTSNGTSASSESKPDVSSSASSAAADA